MLMDMESAKDLAKRLVTAWNEHDDTLLLSFFSEEAVMTSPLIFQLLHIPDGTLRGKPALEKYLSLVSTELRHARFNIHNVFSGVGGFAMHFSTVFEKEAIAVFILDKGDRIVSWTAYFDSLELP